MCVFCEMCCAMLYGVLCVVCVVFVSFVFAMLNLCALGIQCVMLQFMFCVFVRDTFEVFVCLCVALFGVLVCV